MEELRARLADASTLGHLRLIVRVTLLGEPDPLAPPSDNTHIAEDGENEPEALPFSFGDENE